MQEKLPAGRNGFVMTALAVCSGAGVFAQIAEAPFSRAVKHFAILALLASCAYVIMRAPLLLTTTFKYCNVLHQYFEGIKFDSRGLLPLKDEGEAKQIRIGNTKIDYIPDNQAEHKIEDSGAANGIIWMPNSLYFWLKSGSEYQYFPLLSGFWRIRDSKGLTSKIEGVLDSARKDSFDASIYAGKESFDFSESKVAIFLTVSGIHFAWMLVSIVFSIPLYAIIILAIFSVFGNRVLDKLKALQFLSVILYASFPAIIVGTLYSGLALPFLDFMTVCFIFFSIYTLIVINSLQKKFSPSRGDDDGYDDDIF